MSEEIEQRLEVIRSSVDDLITQTNDITTDITNTKNNVNNSISDIADIKAKLDDLVESLEESNILLSDISNDSTKITDELAEIGEKVDNVINDLPSVPSDSSGSSSTTPIPDIIVDNKDVGFTTKGNWPLSGAVDFYGTESLWNASYNDEAKWTFEVSRLGIYDVYGWWTNERSNGSHYTRDHNAQYEMQIDGVNELDDYNVANLTVDHNKSCGYFTLLGRYIFRPGVERSISVSHGDPEGKNSTIADAVKIVFIQAINEESSSSSSSKNAESSSSLPSPLSSSSKEELSSSSSNKESSSSLSSPLSSSSSSQEVPLPAKEFSLVSWNVLNAGLYCMDPGPIGFNAREFHPDDAPGGTCTYPIYCPEPGSPANGYIPDGEQKNKTTGVRTAAIMEWIGEYSPDVLCLNEAGSQYFVEGHIAAKTHLKYFAMAQRNKPFPTWSYNSGTSHTPQKYAWRNQWFYSYPVAITSKWPITQQFEINGLDGRSMMGGYIEELDLWVMAFHAYPGRYTKAFESYWPKWEELQGKRTIVCGDFNTSSYALAPSSGQADDGRVMWALWRYGYEDMGAALPYGTYKNSPSINDSPDVWGGIRIDFIYASASLTSTITPDGYERIHPQMLGGQRVYMSDHAGVRQTFSI